MTRRPIALGNLRQTGGGGQTAESIDLYDIKCLGKVALHQARACCELSTMHTRTPNKGATKMIRCLGRLPKFIRIGLITLTGATLLTLARDIFRTKEEFCARICGACWEAETTRNWVSHASLSGGQNMLQSMQMLY